MVVEPVVSTTGVPTGICVLKGRRQRKAKLPGVQGRLFQVFIFRMIRKYIWKKKDMGKGQD
jgi:hypothetical protein